MKSLKSDKSCEFGGVYRSLSAQQHRKPASEAASGAPSHENETLKPPKAAKLAHLRARCGLEHPQIRNFCHFSTCCFTLARKHPTNAGRIHPKPPILGPWPASPVNNVLPILNSAPRMRALYPELELGALNVQFRRLFRLLVLVFGHGTEDLEQHGRSNGNSDDSQKLKPTSPVARPTN